MSASNDDADKWNAVDVVDDVLEHVPVPKSFCSTPRACEEERGNPSGFKLSYDTTKPYQSVKAEQSDASSDSFSLENTAKSNVNDPFFEKLTVFIGDCLHKEMSALGSSLRTDLREEMHRSVRQRHLAKEGRTGGKSKDHLVVDGPDLPIEKSPSSFSMGALKKPEKEKASTVSKRPLGRGSTGEWSEWSIRRFVKKDAGSSGKKKREDTMVHASTDHGREAEAVVPTLQKASTTKSLGSPSPKSRESGRKSLVGNLFDRAQAQAPNIHSVPTKAAQANDTKRKFSLVENLLEGYLAGGKSSSKKDLSMNMITEDRRMSKQSSFSQNSHFSGEEYGNGVSSVHTYTSSIEYLSKVSSPNHISPDRSQGTGMSSIVPAAEAPRPPTSGLSPKLPAMAFPSGEMAASLPDSNGHSDASSGNGHSQGDVTKPPTLPPLLPCVAADVEDEVLLIKNLESESRHTKPESTIGRDSALTRESADISLCSRRPAMGKVVSFIVRSGSQSTLLTSKASSLGSTAQDSLLFRTRRWCRHVVEHQVFDTIITLLIVINATTIGIQTDFAIQHLDRSPPLFFRVAETFFCIVFTCELAVRLFVYSYKFFLNHEYKWNIFDFLLVVCQLSEEVLSVEGWRSSSTDSYAEFADNANFIRVLRIFRLVRIIRLVRLLRFISELRTMVTSIQASFRALFYACLLLMFMIYVWSVYLIQLIADFGSKEPDKYRQESRFTKYYGSLARAVLTLFQAMTGGVDWDELLEPLMVNISPLMAILFVMYIAFAVLAMMNVITGVFVESALLTAKEDKEAALLQQVRRLFQDADEDCNGVISWEEFQARCSDRDMVKYFKALDIDISEARGLFTLLDTDNSGQVDMEEFVMGCLRLRGPAKAIDLAAMMYFQKRIANRWREHMRFIESQIEDVLDMIEYNQIAMRNESESSPPVANGQEDHHGEEGSLADGMTIVTVPSVDEGTVTSTVACSRASSLVPSRAPSKHGESTRASVGSEAPPVQASVSMLSMASIRHAQLQHGATSEGFESIRRSHVPSMDSAGLVTFSAGLAPERHGVPRRSYRKERCNTNEDDNQFATWAAIKAQGDRKAATEAKTQEF